MIQSLGNCTSATQQQQLARAADTVGDKIALRLCATVQLSSGGLGGHVLENTRVCPVLKQTQNIFTCVRVPKGRLEKGEWAQKWDGLLFSKTFFRTLRVEEKKAHSCKQKQHNEKTKQNRFHYQVLARQKEGLRGTTGVWRHLRKFKFRECVDNKNIFAASL